MGQIFGITTEKKIIPVTVDDNGYLQIDLQTITAGTNLIGRVDARNGDKIISFEDNFRVSVSDTSLAAGNPQLDGTPCPDGEVQVVTTIGYMHSGSGTILRLDALIKASGVPFKTNASVTSGRWEGETVNIWLKPDDFIRLNIIGATLNDDAYLRYSGYKFQI